LLHDIFLVMFLKDQALHMLTLVKIYKVSRMPNTVRRSRTGGVSVAHWMQVNDHIHAAVRAHFTH
jgi:hypothetical protein